MDYDDDDNLEELYLNRFADDITDSEESEAEEEVAEKGPEKITAADPNEEMIQAAMEVRPMEENAKKKTPKIRKLKSRLTEDRLAGKDGFPALVDFMSKFKTNKGNEIDDFNRLMQFYKIWAKKLYSDKPFDDVVYAVEKLCHKKRMRVYLSNVRKYHEEKYSWEEIKRQSFPSLEMDERDDNDSPMDSQIVPLPVTSTQATGLTEEMKLRMERNLREALERKRIKEQERLKIQEDSLKETTTQDMFNEEDALLKELENDELFN
ncbi:Swi3-domain-containing protein [Rozella allomycis CSF55]|uniref:Chromosome segregation in meiosis protein n=1 Tax=Rozella allomycis (strain CSF55) TaxID=988480 RepID=A0A4P9YLP5_ROZAC|nr:Swi3-domain-containing protein [Rozella allomycis CSF55]